MGLITMGMPKEIAIKLAAINKCKVFIETGTLKGKTTLWAASQFEEVHTIERSEVLFNLYSGNLNSFRNIKAHMGDSRDILPLIVSQLSDKNTIYWLDGHWSGGKTAGAEDECPLLDELRCLVGRTNDIILIDDARLFLCVPPKPHKSEQWPTLFDIFQIFSTEETKRFIQVIDDVIFIVPNQSEIKASLIDYVQREKKISESPNNKLEEISENKNNVHPILKKIKAYFNR